MTEQFPTLQVDIGVTALAVALGACLVPGPATTATARIHQAWAGPDHTLVTLTLRSAFDLYLSALALPVGCHVLMSAINHPDMVAIVRAHGLVPMPIDVDPQTMAPLTARLHRAVSAQARMLVVAHLFGGRLPLDDLATFCRAHSLLLVEDCAQVYGGGYRGSPLSDAAFFSFGPMKTGTALGGAVAIVRDPSLLAQMAARQAGYPRQTRRDYASRLVKYAAIGAFLRSLPAMALAARVVRGTRIRLSDVLRAMMRNVGGGFHVERLRQQPAPPLLRLLAWRLRHPDFRRTGLRQAAGIVLSRAIGDTEQPGRAGLDHLHWIFPIVVTAPEAVQVELQAQGFHAMRGLSNLGTFQPPTERPDLIPHEAVRITEQALLLPMHPGLHPEAVIRLAKTLRQCRPAGDPMTGVGEIGQPDTRNEYGHAASRIERATLVAPDHPT